MSAWGPRWTADDPRLKKYQDQIAAQIAPSKGFFPPTAIPTLPRKEKPARARPKGNPTPSNEPTAPPDRPSPSSQPEPPVRDASMESDEGETLYSGRVSVRITSYRRQLLDPDNLCAKWFLDSCRYSRLIQDDRPQDITFQVAQEKVSSKEEERTEILIQPLSP